MIASKKWRIRVKELLFLVRFTQSWTHWNFSLKVLTHKCATVSLQKGFWRRPNASMLWNRSASMLWSCYFDLADGNISPTTWLWSSYWKPVWYTPSFIECSETSLRLKWKPLWMNCKYKLPVLEGVVAWFIRLNQKIYNILVYTNL